MLKYPEQVFARIIRVDHEEELFLRLDTSIQFGKSSNLLGLVIMTNPGSFSFRDHEDWINFKEGFTTYSVFEGYGKPDLTMQNVIKVIREAYHSSNLTPPNGRVKIVNLSSIIENKKDLVEHKHSLALEKMLENKITTNLINEPIINNEYEFIKTCNELDFVLVGFADGIFSSRISRLLNWIENPAIKDKVIYARDNQGRLSHPRRWRTEPYLMEKCISIFRELLTRQSEVSFKREGYTFLRWNGLYSSDAKFVVRDNSNGLQSVFTPGRVQDLVWTSADLANTPELSKWDTFAGETVDDLEEVAF